MGFVKYAVKLKEIAIRNECRTFHLEKIIEQSPLLNSATKSPSS